MVYNNVQQIWTFTDVDYFEEIKAKGEGGGWLALHTKGFRLEFFTSSLKSRVKKLIIFRWRVNGKHFVELVGLKKET